MDFKRVVVTGMGVVSPVGNTITQTWEALCNGKSGITVNTCFDPSGFDSKIAGLIKGFDPSKYFSTKEVRRTEKFVQYAVACAKMAVEDSGIVLEKEDPYRIGVMVGSGIGSLRIVEEQSKIMAERGAAKISPFLIPMLIVNMAPGQISISLGIKGPNSCVATACATGTHAIGDAFKIIQRGDADVMIAGGTESCITPLGVGGFCALKALATRNDEPDRAR